MPLFSIIIPVYNSEGCLAEAVGSVVRQNFKSLEIILVDDGSTDKSGALCDSFVRQHEFIKVIHHEKNSGVSAARNTALKAARGDYVLFLDSDDRLVDGSLTGLANLIEERSNPDLIIGKYTSEKYSLRGDAAAPQDFTFDNAAIRPEDPDGAVAHLKSFNGLAGVCWRFAVNRNFLVQNNLYFIPARIYEDEAYVVRLLCLAKTFAFYDRCLYDYRTRETSLTQTITHSVNYDNSAACLRVVGDICSLAFENDFSDLKKKFLNERIKTALTTFYGYLPLHNREEIRQFSQILGANDHCKMLGDIFSLKDFIIKKTVALADGAKNKRIYLFCADLFGKTTAQILKNEGFAVAGFLDNNKGLEGETVLGLRVNTPFILSNQSKEELADIFVIVCHQCKDVFEKMAGQLEKLGLLREQIAHQLFL